MLFPLALSVVMAAPDRSLVVYNPHNLTVTEVHMIQSAHFDAGCKTPLCGETRAGEPLRCAKVNPHTPVDPLGFGEPYNYHIVNRYFDEFLLKAVVLANASRGTDMPYRHMTQSWLLSLFFDCENSGMLSWEGSGWPAKGLPVLHCPNATTIAEVKAAVIRGDIFYHGFPFNAEASFYPDASTFNAALDITASLSKDLGISTPTAVSQRDVPGWTRATIPLLAKRGINGISFGSGTPPGKPDTPPLFLWKDLPSGTEVVTTFETAYGTAATVFVLPNGVALAAAWRGDNTGPGPIPDVQNDYAMLRKEFPDAKVFSSTFDAFFTIANQPEVKSKLPIVTEEIEDGWIYGVPSDPLKNAMFREISRQRTGCVISGKCDPTSAAIIALDRLLVKVPEHTWGISTAWFLKDYENYTNVQFEAARSIGMKQGFLTDNRLHADYNTTANSWLEQRSYLTDASKVVANQYPALAASIDDALAVLKDVKLPSKHGMSPVSNPVGRSFTCGTVELAFDARAALAKLSVHGGSGSSNISTKGNGNASGSNGVRSWASPSNPMGLYQYQSFTNKDYNIFLQDFAIRIDGGDCHYLPNSTDDTGCGGFRKPNVTSANPKRRNLTPTMTALWASDDTCSFVAEATLPEEAHKLAGAPSTVIIAVNVSSSSSGGSSIVTWDVLQVDKTATRLPEASFFSFVPDVQPDGWSLSVLGSTMDPTDVLAARGVYGGSPHLRGVESVSYSSRLPESTPLESANGESARGGGEAKGAAAAVSTSRSKSFTLSSLDVPIVSTGGASPFVTPRTEAPDMKKGVHFNIHQNIWNTNYVLWYPFDGVEKDIRSRFSLDIH